MGQFDTHFQITIGGAGPSASFQLEDYSATSTPIRASGVGETGRVKSIKGTGWVEGADAAAFNSALLAVQAAMAAKGQDVKVLGISGLAEFAILAAQCIEGGPNIEFELLDNLDGSALTRRIRFTAEGKTAPDGGGGGGTEDGSYKQSVRTPPDGLETITRTGELITGGATAQFTAAILPAFKAMYPLPDFVIDDVTLEADQNDLHLRYSVTAKRLRSPLPAASMTLNGEAYSRKNRDEKYRKVETIGVDLVLGSPDFQPVYDVVRASAVAIGPICREQMTFTRHRENRLQATFEIVLGADGNQLLDWNTEIEFIDDNDSWKEFRFPGLDPILVRADKGLRKIVQSGTAIGAGVYPKPPPPLFPAALLEPMRVKFTKISEFECQTSWTYQMAGELGSSATAPSSEFVTILARPSQPEFF